MLNPASRVLCEKWGFSPTPSDPQPARRRIPLPPTDEHWREPGSIVSYTVKSRTSRKEREMGNLAEFLGRICRIPVRPFDYIVKAGNRPAATPLQEEDLADSKEENNA
jgi:hypothetical protein